MYLNGDSIYMENQKHSHTTNEVVEDKYSEYLMPIWKDLHTPMERASGSKLYDFNGEEFIDLFSGISVTNSGHSNDVVNDAAKSQIDKFSHGCSYIHPNQPVGNLAQKLAEITPGNLKKSFFCNSGTEAVEGAIKLARKFTGSTEVIAVEMGFHGRTLGALALTGSSTYKKGMAPTINNVSHIPAPYAYRCENCGNEKCGADCANALERVINSHTSDDLAAVIIEPVIGEGGIIVPSKRWIDRIKEITHSHDALLIADEVQTGYGRTGKMFACDHFDLVPDIITQAKGIANGFPLGALTAPSYIANSFESGDHFSTFGGNPVSCAAAIANIQKLQEDIIPNINEKEMLLKSKLGEMVTEFEIVGENRGLGLMRGIEIINPDESSSPLSHVPQPDPERASKISKKMRDEGIVVGVGGFYNNVIRVQPPLNLPIEDLKYSLNSLNSQLGVVQGSRS